MLSQNTVVKILGASFTKVSAASLTKTPSKVLSTEEQSSAKEHNVAVEDSNNATSTIEPISEPGDGSETTVKFADERVLDKPSSSTHVSENDEACFIQLQELSSSLTGVPVEDMHGDSLLENIGLDSLMTVEVLGRTRKDFQKSRSR